MEVEVILIYRQDPLPYSGIASRTEIYRRYIESDNHHIDHIICPKPNRHFDKVQYTYYKPLVTPFNSLNKKLEKLAIYKALKNIVKPKRKYIVKVIDDSGLLIHLKDLFKTKFANSNFFTIYCIHGYELNFTPSKMRTYNEIVDLNVYLTMKSYDYNKAKHNVLTPLSNVIHNGVDIDHFKPVEKRERHEIKKMLNIPEDSPIFFWCSQDRQKKGLSLTLNFFKTIKRKYPKALLLIAGINRTIQQNGIMNLGKIPNLDLPKYYQIADVYLFTSLCYEGFPLSLTEALKCGCYCIASDYGGVEEVLNFGKYGRLIKRPHFKKEWIDAIDEYFNNPIVFDRIPEEKYSSKKWNQEMNKLLMDIKNMNE